MTDRGNDKEFRMTQEEMDKFEKAFKDEKFRELLVEYAKEISDPENRKKYEEEIAQMERERGSDIKFVNPEGGFVVKTKRTDGDVKMFVNICYNEHIKPAKSRYVDKGKDGKRQSGYHWDVPYSLTHGRDDLDRAGSKCIVYDAVFHPDTYKRGEQDTRFRKVMIDTALDGLEIKHGIKIDKEHLKFPKMKFKGVRQATVIRTPSSEPSKENPDQLAGGLKFPYPYSKQGTQTAEPDNGHANNERDKTSETAARGENSDPTQPQYRVVHRGHVDLQNFTNARDVNATTRPRELVIYIDLPLLKSAAPVELDIFEKRLLLDCKMPPYHLDLALPYPVDEENGSAKFDKSKCQLVVTVPVQPPPAPPVMETALQAPANAEDDERTGCLVTPGPEFFSKDHEHMHETHAAEAQDLNRDGMDVENEEQVAQQRENNDNGELSADTSNGEQVDDVRFELPSYSELPSPFFKCPPYTFHQDEDTVVFVVNVPRVALDTVSLGFSGNKCYISFPSSDSSPPAAQPDYALYVQFPVDHNLDPNLCKIDVSQKNLVLTLQKNSCCKGLWENFKIGPSEEELEDRRFVTEESVQRMMEEIAQQDPWASPSYDTNLKVTSVEENFLEVELESKLRESEESTQEERQKLSLNQAENMADASLSSKMERVHLYSSNLNGPGFSPPESCGLPAVKSERSESERSTDGEPSCTDEGDDQFSSSELVARSIQMRKSCLRRTSSTSTDDEVEIFSGSPESPNKNVRFNMNHQIRVFSNRKDKKKRRLEQRIKAESKKATERAKAAEQKNDNMPGNTDSSGISTLNVQENAANGDQGTRTDVATKQSGSAQPVLTNNLIFELDD